jgi:hypothetical protein
MIGSELAESTETVPDCSAGLRLSPSSEVISLIVITTSDDPIASPRIVIEPKGTSVEPASTCLNRSTILNLTEDAGSEELSFNIAHEGKDTSVIDATEGLLSDTSISYPATPADAVSKVIPTGVIASIVLIRTFCTWTVSAAAPVMRRKSETSSNAVIGIAFIK